MYLTDEMAIAARGKLPSDLARSTLLCLASARPEREPCVEMAVLNDSPSFRKDCFLLYFIIYTTLSNRESTAKQACHEENHPKLLLIASNLVYLMPSFLSLLHFLYGY